MSEKTLAPERVILALQDYANYLKHRPMSMCAHDWIKVPVSQQELDASDNREYWINFASNWAN